MKRMHCEATWGDVFFVKNKEMDHPLLWSPEASPAKPQKHCFPPSSPLLPSQEGTERKLFKTDGSPLEWCMIFIFLAKTPNTEQKKNLENFQFFKS